MGWHFVDDVERYAERVWPLVAADPIRNTIALTAIASLRADRHRTTAERPVPEKPTLGWYDDGNAITGAVSCTPPYPLLLAVIPPGSEVELADALLVRGASIPSLSGPRDDVRRMAELWTARTGRAAETEMRQRLYALSTLSASTAPGRPRRGGTGDVDRAAGWLKAFQSEAHVPDVPTTPWAESRIADGLLWLWEDTGGVPVAMAARSPIVSGMTRIGPVYTPEAQRRNGYGAAVTAACTRDALDHGVSTVVLFTDLANPTSNAIYQRLGYRPVDDREVLRFVGDPT